MLNCANLRRYFKRSYDGIKLIIAKFYIIIIIISFLYLTHREMLSQFKSLLLNLLNIN